MISRPFIRTISAIGLFLIPGFSLIGAYSQTTKSKFAYGKKSDQDLAEKLWQSLLSNRMVGRDRINVHAFTGKRPHGAVQQIYSATIEVDDHAGRAIVKANHGRKGATVQNVYDTPNKYLSGYTVMFANKPGYDPENNDWFWVHFQPSGKVNRAKNGLAVAGRVGKFSDFGCIACHKKVGGKDYEALTSK